MASSHGPQVIQWIVDTRDLWPEAKKTKDLEIEAPEALALLTAEERAGVLKYFFVRDAKMSLASHLLKHYVVGRHLGLPWAATTLTRQADGKPVYKDPATGRQPLQFNVSHQAGLVALAAVVGYGGDNGNGDGGEGLVDVGVDVVCTSERRARDLKMVRDEGWPRFVDMHSDVFGRSEVGYLKTEVPAQAAREVDDADDEDARANYALRSFYTLWCLREAYVKMTGEALLAKWLPDLEFRHFRAPARAVNFKGDGDGETVVTAHEVVFEGRPVDDANICLRALGPDYMACTAVRTPRRKEDGLGWELGPYEFITIDAILEHVRGEKTA